MKSFKSVLVLVAIAGVLTGFLVSCSSLTESVIGGAKRGAGQAVEERVAAALYSKLAPKEQTPAPGSTQWGPFMATQAQIIFSYTFTAGGYWLGEEAYKEGEYTKFKWQPTDDEPVIMEKAFLKRLDDGNEWWRVSWADNDGDTWIYEALLSPTEEKMIRLRARDVDGNEGEVPLTEESVYVPPAAVSDESIKGATVGREEVKTPAGTFTADHVVFMSSAGEGNIEWWITDKVPGGVVKYIATDNEKKEVWESILTEAGSNAKTILKSY